MSRLPQPGERARILPSEVMDRIGATGRCGVVLPTKSITIAVKLDDPSGIPSNLANGPGEGGVVFCTISEVELLESEGEGS